MPAFRPSHEGAHGSRAAVPRHALAQRQVHGGVLLRASPPGRGRVSPPGKRIVGADTAGASFVSAS